MFLHSFYEPNSDELGIYAKFDLSCFSIIFINFNKVHCYDLFTIVTSLCVDNVLSLFWNLKELTQVCIFITKRTHVELMQFANLFLVFGETFTLHVVYQQSDIANI